VLLLVMMESADSGFIAVDGMLLAKCSAEWRSHEMESCRIFNAAAGDRERKWDGRCLSEWPEEFTRERSAIAARWDAIRRV